MAARWAPDVVPGGVLFRRRCFSRDDGPSLAGTRFYRACEAQGSSRSHFSHPPARPPFTHPPPAPPQVVLALLPSASPAVALEASSALLSLSRAPSAAKAAALHLAALLPTRADAAVKLAACGRLARLARTRPDAARATLPECLQALRAEPARPTQPRVRAAVLAAAIPALLGRRTAAVSVAVLAAEVERHAPEGTVMGDAESADHRRGLIQAIARTVVAFPAEATEPAVRLVAPFLGDASPPAALAAVRLLRGIATSAVAPPAVRADAVLAIANALPACRDGRTAAGAVWALGRGAADTALHPSVAHAVIAALESALSDDSAAADGMAAAEAPAAVPSAGPALNPDGSYAASAPRPASAGSPAASCPRLGSVLALVRGGDEMLGATVAAAAAKALLRLGTDGAADGGFSPEDFRRRSVEWMLLLARLLTAARRGAPLGGAEADADSRERVALALRALGAAAGDGGDAQALRALLLDAPREAEERRRRRREGEASYRLGCAPPDAPLPARQLPAAASVAAARKDGGRGTAAVGVEDDGGWAAAAAAAAFCATDPGLAFLDASNGGTADDDDATCGVRTRIVQLTGLSDPVYAEALVSVRGLDVALEVTLANRTPRLLSGIVYSLAARGGLRVAERPGAVGTLAPLGDPDGGDVATVRAAARVTEACAGALVGSLGWAEAGRPGAPLGDRGSAACADVVIALADLIVPAPCAPAPFRALWAEYEWENKVPIVTRHSSPRALVRVLCASCRLCCLTPLDNDDDDASALPFLAANLYGRSAFGDAALLNLSVEVVPGAAATRGGCAATRPRLEGHVRIRAKTQALALALGDGVTVAMRGGDR